MSQCESSAMGGAALLRLSLLYRMLRAGEVLALVALVSWSSWYVPSAVAAALRLAGSLLLNARFVFFLGNAIVLLLFALSRHDLSSSTSSSASNDEQQQPSSASTPVQQQAASASVVPPVADAASADSFGSFTTTTTPATTTLPSSMGVETAAAEAASFATPVPEPVVRRADMMFATREPDQVIRRADMMFATPEPEPVIRRADMMLLEDMHQHQAAVARSSVVSTKARAPRRSRSEKMGSRPASRRAASPELRRCESENGRRRRSSVTARDAEACSWGREDADEFRRTVEAFIARQTRFHREESLSMATRRSCQPEPAITGALAVVE